MEMEPQQHPLQNLAVLRHLFNLAPMTFKDFKNVRLVCRSWYQETLSLWRKSVVLTLHEASFGIQPNSLIAEILNPHPESILRLGETPYDKYKLRDLTLDMRYLENSGETTAFWTVLVPFVKHLTLQNVKWIGVRNAPSGRSCLLRFLRERMSHLEHLALSSVDMSQDTFQEGNLVEEPGLPALISLSMANTKAFCLTDFPNLKTLRLTEAADFMSTPMADPLVRPPQVKNSSVTRLEVGWLVEGSLNIVYPTVFQVRFTALEHLEIFADVEMLATSDQENSFLRAHMTQLQSCNLVQWNLAHRPPEAPFTTDLFNLTEVRLYGNLTVDLTFFRFTPNLKLLHVDVLNFGREKEVMKMIRPQDMARLRVRFRGWHNTRPNVMERDLVKNTVERGVPFGFTLPHLTRLFLNCQLSPDSVKALADWMPNVKDFKAVLNPVTLKIGLQKWARLTFFHCLIGSRLTDIDLPTMIPLMHNLQSFRYDSSCGDSGFITAEGFLNLPTLVSLQLCVSQHFSEETEALLKEKIQHVQIYRNYAGNPNHGSWKCCRFKEYDRKFLRHLRSQENNGENPRGGRGNPLDRFRRPTYGYNVVIGDPNFRM